MGFQNVIVQKVSNQGKSVIRQEAELPLFPSVRSWSWPGITFTKKGLKTRNGDRLWPGEGVLLKSCMQLDHRRSVQPRLCYRCTLLPAE